MSKASQVLGRIKAINESLSTKGYKCICSYSSDVKNSLGFKYKEAVKFDKVLDELDKLGIQSIQPDNMSVDGITALWVKDSDWDTALVALQNLK